MPWKEKEVKQLRLEFVLRALSEVTPFVELCREYGIERKTGYKWKKRFLEEGAAGLSDRSRRPQSHGRELKERVVCEIVRLKRAHIDWGPRKIREVYGRKHGPGGVPSESSFKRVLEQAGLVKKRRRRRSQDSGRLENRVESREPNDVWTVDFKGYWYTSEGERCEPLTIRDDCSRYVLHASPPANSRTETIRNEFERTFSIYGLPKVIRSDNGSPFAASTAPLGLSRLSVWWLALGIDLDRIDPGCPSQNGGHERMHRDIACEVEHRVEGGLSEQVAALETWRRIFNEERPHEAIGMRFPAEVYRKSSRSYQGTPEVLDYPQGFAQRKVSSSGSIRFHGHQIRISGALVGWHVGLEPLPCGQISVYFGTLCLGLLDLQTESFKSHQKTEGSQSSRKPGRS